jgi:hypothetical protein
MLRKRYANRLEDLGAFKRRKYCSLSCANTKTTVGYHGESWRAKKHKSSSCELCESTHLVAAHHCNENRSDNEPENLQTLCASCHSWWHHEARRRGLSPAGRAEIRA